MGDSVAACMHAYVHLPIDALAHAFIDSTRQLLMQSFAYWMSAVIHALTQYMYSSPPWNVWRV